MLLLTSCSEQVEESHEPTEFLSLSEHDICHDRTSLIKFIRLKELEYHIPCGLLQAIIFVESSYRPFTLNISKKTHSYKTKEEAVNKAKTAVRRGYQIDIGICQINYKFHGSKFKTINEMVNPINNIDYAAKLLILLYKTKKNNWYSTIQAYHGSKNKDNNIKYMNRVLNKRDEINRIV